MPRGSGISSADIETLVAWIQGIQDEEEVPSSTIPPVPIEPPLNSSRVTRNGFERFGDAMTIVNAKCMSCHAGRNDFPRDGTQASLDEALWRSSGMIVAGNAMTSRLVIRLSKPVFPVSTLTNGNPLKNLIGNMPQNGPALSVAEAATLADWIDMINLPNSQLIVIPAGTGTGTWTPAGKPIVATVGDRLRVRNLDSVSHSIHANGGRPFEHGIDKGDDERVNFGGAQDFTYINPANSVNGSDLIYDHFRSGSNGIQINFIITAP
jgi:hypothetical protein